MKKMVVIIMMVLCVMLFSVREGMAKKVKVGLFSKKCFTEERQLKPKSIEYTYEKGKFTYMPGILGNEPCRIIPQGSADEFTWSYNNSPDFLELSKLELNKDIKKFIATKKIPINVYQGGEISPSEELEPGYYCFHLGHMYNHEMQTSAKIWDFVVLGDAYFKELELSVESCEKFWEYLIAADPRLGDLFTDLHKKQLEVIEEEIIDKNEFLSAVWSGIRSKYSYKDTFVEKFEDYFANKEKFTYSFKMHLPRPIDFAFHYDKYIVIPYEVEVVEIKEYLNIYGFKATGGKIDYLYFILQ